MTEQEEKCPSPICSCHEPKGEGQVCHDHGARLLVENSDVKEQMIEREELLYDLAQLYKVFGDETRLRILGALMSGEQSVGALATRLDMTLSAVSHSLRVLKGARLVRCRREGKAVFYAL
ncbi:MAG: winged helix-turn-helix transcriptional regulator, partial [Clostridia bacterium]|nr:winged helix-turn-helix transcriptional regulator [Clostridia bacterium]